jgi:hypothetical protein
MRFVLEIDAIIVVNLSKPVYLLIFPLGDDAIPIPIHFLQLG